MVRAIQNEKGEWISEKVSWGMKEIKDARKFLQLRFDDAPFINTTIQEMQDALITDFGDDPAQIERAIILHFKKRKL